MASMMSESEVDQAQRPEEESAFLLDFLRQFGDRCHFAGFQQSRY
jgi:hypothetical protein